MQSTWDLTVFLLPPTLILLSKNRNITTLIVLLFIIYSIVLVEFVRMLLVIC